MANKIIFNTQVAVAAVWVKAVVLLLYIHFLFSSRCVWGFSVRSLFSFLLCFVSFLGLQSSCLGLESWIYLCCVYVMSLLSFFGSSTRYRRLVCSK